jgi:hypothetical protein
MNVQAMNAGCRTPEDEAFFLDGAIFIAREATRDAEKALDEARSRHAAARHRLHTYLTLRNKLPPYRQDVKPCAICRVGFVTGGEVESGIGEEHGNGGFCGYAPVHTACANRAVEQEYLKPAGTGPNGVRLFRVIDEAIGIGRYE